HVPLAERGVTPGPPAQPMTESIPTGTDDQLPAGQVRHQITVPEHVPMVALLGQRDEVLTAIEAGFPQVDVHVRGNLVTMTGNPGDVALAERLLDELTQIASSDQPLAADAVERAIAILNTATTDRPAQ